MKKIMILVITFLIVPNFSNAYIDLASNHFAYKEIVELKENEIALGYPDDTFRPDSYITEEELITILLRGANLEACKNFNNWPEDYIELGINNGIVVDGSLVEVNEFFDFAEKIGALPTINEFSNNLYKRNCEMDRKEGYLTRAEACVYISKWIKYDGKTTLKDLPQETEVYYTNDEDLNISTVIKVVEVFEYDSYNGRYSEVTNQIKTGEHRYLKGRNKNAQGKYIVAIEFDTINNSKYGMWTSYKSLKFEGVEIKDAFDTDEINSQINNCVYDATLVKPNKTHTVIAFYVLDKMPEELIINRDITTLYDLQTHEYINCNSFSTINIKF